MSTQTTTKRPTYIAWAREHLDDVQAACERVHGTDRKEIVETPWGGIEVQQTLDDFVLFAVGYRMFDERSCDMGVVLYPQEPREDRIRKLRLQLTRVERMNRGRAALQ